MKGISKRLATLSVFMILCVTSASAQGKESLTASQIMARVASVYSSCSTYLDEGAVTVATANGMSLDYLYGANRAQRIQRFSTAFRRPASFRFEFSSGSGIVNRDRIIAWKEEGVEKSWWWLGPHDAPLGRTLRGFAGFSQDLSQTVPALLLPDLFPAGGLLASVEGLKATGHDKLEGRAALRLEGKYERATIKIWIDASEFLILKIVRQETTGPFEAFTTITFKPQINGDIARDKLAFNPPPEAPPPQSIARHGSDDSPWADSQIQQKARPAGSGLSLLPRKAKPRPKQVADQRGNQQEVILESDADDVIRVDTTLVALDVLAQDKQGNFVKGLTGGDFVVTEDGQQQEVTTYALGDDLSRSRNIVLIIDYSGSQLPFLKTSVEAAKTLVDQLNPKDQMAVVTDDVSVLVDFTQDKVELKKNLDSLVKAVSSEHRLGRSAQYSALMATLDMLFANTDAHPIIIFQTDGDELPGLRPVAAFPPPTPMAPHYEKKFSIVDVFSNALLSRATIYTVIPGIQLVGLPASQQLARVKTMWKTQNTALDKLRAKKYRGRWAIKEKDWTDEDWQDEAASVVWTQQALVTLSQICGGWAAFLEQSEQAADIYSRILGDINRRYIIGYQPTNKARDGKLRRVTVEVRGHPEYVVLGRKSYYAPFDQR